VIDFTGLEDPPVCETLFGMSDADLAAQFGGPAETDWNGHGSNLVSLKISQWCGSTWDSTVLAAFVAAADLGVDVVSISFGGYLDRSNPEEELIDQAYIDAVAYARSKGTIIVAAAGNEHLRVGAGGRVVSHGPTATPGTDPADFQDYFGLYETRAGCPGWSTCPRPTGWSSRPRPAARPAPSATRTPTRRSRPTSPPPASRPATPYQAAGQGNRDQLAYSSNYGPGSTSPARVGPASSTCPTSTGAAPRVPLHQRRPDQRLAGRQHHRQLGDPDPVLLPQRGRRLPQGQCSSTIQGTSMAAPHVAASLALVASATRRWASAQGRSCPASRHGPTPTSTTPPGPCRPPTPHPAT
jgi:subtilisin family serine protease